jgi:glycosidase
MRGLCFELRFVVAYSLLVSRRCCIPSFAVCCLVTAVWVQAQPAPDFLPGQSIYQIFTDRFFDGDAANNNASSSFNASSGTGVHGGDFKGIEQKLDYIKALGATALWLSPVVLNGNGEYHGYAGRNFYQVDPHWGTLSNLQSLVSAAHAKGLLVIQDVVVNHGGTLVTTTTGNTTFNYPSGYTLRYSSASRQYAAPFNTNASFPTLNALFHNYGEIQDYNNVTQAELGELSGLDDFRTELPYIRTNMAAVYNYWIQAAGFDGFRVDTVKHTEMGFWQDWCPRIHAFAATNGKPNFFMFGEVYDGNDAKCGSYTGTQGGGAFKHDSVLDFPLYYKMNSVFATASGNTKLIEDRYAALAGNYDPASHDQLVTFLDNHDLTRFLNSANANGNTNRLAVALAFLYTARGVPCLYQGTEQAFNGGADPNNREDMFDGSFEQGPSLGDNFNMTHPLFQRVAMLNNFRRLYPALRTGFHTNLYSNAAGPGLFAYARRLGTQEVFVVFNTASTVQSLPSRPTLYSAGTTLVNLLDTNETFVVVAGPATPAIEVPGTTAKMFIAQSQQLPLDPVVEAVTPGHDAASVPALTPLVVQFSAVMDTNSVQAAFSCVPAVAGTFAWSPAHDAFTFTPATSWPGLSLITIRIGETAKAANTTNQLHGAFESRFRTATATDVTRPTATLLSPTNGGYVAGQEVVSGTAADNISVAKVEVRLDNRDWVIANGTTTWNYTVNTSNALNGTHIIAVRATDTAGNLSLTNVVNVRFLNVPGDYLQRIACGNPGNVTNCDGAVWMADAAYTSGAFGYSGGTGGNVANPISGICAAAQTLHQRERYSTSGDGFRYWFDCPPGIYETTVLEAETWWNVPGERVFHLFIEGTPALTNFDVLAAAGGKNLPVVRTLTNNVADAQLELLFVPVVDNARVSGVQVRKLADLFSDTDGIPDWWRLAYFDHAMGQGGDASRAEDDADGDGAVNGQEFQAGTNPQDSSSVFRITGVIASGGSLQIQWTTVTNRTYQLEAQELLSGANAWADIGPVVVGSGSPATLLVAGSAAAKLFRVRLK